MTCPALRQRMTGNTYGFAPGNSCQRPRLLNRPTAIDWLCYARTRHVVRVLSLDPLDVTPEDVIVPVRRDLDKIREKIALLRTGCSDLPACVEEARRCWMVNYLNP